MSEDILAHAVHPARLLDAEACMKTARAGAERSCVSLATARISEWHLCLFAGLANGVLLRTEVDRVTGQLSDTRYNLVPLSYEALDHASSARPVHLSLSPAGRSRFVVL